MWRRRFSIALFALLGGLASPACGKEPRLGELTVAEVERRLHEPGFHVFDANARDAWEKGHVPGARWVQYNHVTAADLPADKQATLVFYCANEH